MTSQTDSQTNPLCPDDDDSATARRLRHLAAARAKARTQGLSLSTPDENCTDVAGENCTLF